jgi:hypothetical protein
MAFYQTILTVDEIKKDIQNCNFQKETCITDNNTNIHLVACINGAVNDSLRKNRNYKEFEMTNYFKEEMKRDFSIEYIGNVDLFR